MNFILEKNEISSKLDIYEPLLIINKINIKTLDKTAELFNQLIKQIGSSNVIYQISQ